MALEQLLAQTYFDNTLQQYLVFFAFVIGGFLLAKIVAFIDQRVIRKIAKKTKIVFNDLILNLLEKPLLYMLSVLLCL